jgi:hypothetical protein
MKENKGGRPKKIDEKILQKLERGFLQGLSDRECCLYADISPATLYNYCNENPEFSERKELLKEQLKIQAKINISNKLVDGDVHLSQWYLERKAKDEFGYKQEIQHSGEMTTKQEIKHDLSKLDVKELKQLETLLTKSEGD